MEKQLKEETFWTGGNIIPSEWQRMTSSHHNQSCCLTSSLRHERQEVRESSLGWTDSAALAVKGPRRQEQTEHSGGFCEGMFTAVVTSSPAACPDIR